MARIETNSATEITTPIQNQPTQGPRQKRALLFAPYFLPRRRVGSMRPFRFAIHLEEFGWKPTILTIKASGQRLTPREAELLKDIDIIEINSPVDRTTRSESQLRVSKDALKADNQTFATKILKNLDQQFPIDTWLPLFLAQYGKLKEIVKDVDPHVIWATADPWSSLVVGQRLARRFRIPFFPDFRDPWTLSDLRAAYQWKASRAIDSYFEKRVLKGSDVVIFQTPLVQEMYRRHYDDITFASTSIPNSFDPDVFVDDIDLDTADARPAATPDGLRIGFFGRFRRMSPAKPVTDVLATIRRTDADAAKRIQIYSFGPLSLDDEEYAGDRGVLSCFNERPPVALENALSVLREFDILLLSTEQTRKEIIPSKLFEYLVAGRPILSLSKSPEVERILNTTGTGIQLRTAREAAALLTGCLKARQNKERMPIPFDPDEDEIMQFEARKTTRDLAEVFDMIVEPVGNNAG